MERGAPVGSTDVSAPATTLASTCGRYARNRWNGREWRRTRLSGAHTRADTVQDQPPARRTIMVTSAAAAGQHRQPDHVDLKALKARQQGAWSSGDYAITGNTLQIVGEELCEALDLHSGTVFKTYYGPQRLWSATTMLAPLVMSYHYLVDHPHSEAFAAIHASYHEALANRWLPAPQRRHENRAATFCSLRAEFNTLEVAMRADWGRRGPPI